MSDASDRYRTIADGFTSRLEGAAGDSWLAATPCSEWTVRDLIGHVVGTHRRVLATLDGSEPEPDLAVADRTVPSPYHPATARLVLEVSPTTTLDRNLLTTPRLYAAV